MRDRQTRRCVHRWLLEEPGPRTVRGVCRRCGARRTYPVEGWAGASFGASPEAGETPLLPASALDEAQIDSVSISLSAVDRYGSVAAERC